MNVTRRLCALGVFFAASIPAAFADTRRAFPGAAFPGAAFPGAAFPGASGHGSETVGGSGRHLPVAKTTIFRVRTLADGGPDSFRACATATMPRVCLFEVSGRMTLTSRLVISSPYLTIAGQTAPAPGITLTGGGLQIRTHDVLIRHLAIRPGDAPEGVKPSDRDGITVHGKEEPAYNILLDHVSLTWALDENMDVYGENAHDVTVSNAIIAEGLYHSIHPKGPHSMGMLVNEGVQRVSVHDSLFAHNNDRNPRQKAGSALEFLNNVVYGWGGMNGGHGANPSDSDHTDRPTLLTFAGNVYIPGPGSPKREPIFVNPPSAALRIFVEHNVGPGRSSDTGDEWTVTNLPASPYRALTPPFPISNTKIKAPSETQASVLAHAGARPAARDAIDSRIVQEVRSGSGEIRDCISGCSRPAGGWPNADSRTAALQLPAEPFADSNQNGYTNLEEWLNCLATALEENGKATECK